MTAPALLLSRGDVAQLLQPADYLSAVEAAFRADKQGHAHAPPPLHIPAHGGGFHAKGASLDSGRPYVAVKLNGNFPGNPERTGLPTIQGAILLCDAATGSLLAIIDSAEITMGRTAAASALAARYLARPESARLCLIGCGEQSRAQAIALGEVLPLRHCLAIDLDRTKAERFAQDIALLTAMECALGDGVHAASGCDVVVTCTTSHVPILALSNISPGTFVAAVGADSPAKHELAPELMAAAKVVVDSAAQCAEFGDLHHAIAAGALALSDIHADLGELVTSAKHGRRDSAEITVFDSTGTALQDVATAALAFERAIAGGIGTLFDLAGPSPAARQN